MEDFWGVTAPLLDWVEAEVVVVNKVAWVGAGVVAVVVT